MGTKKEHFTLYLHVYIDNKQTEQVKETAFLGVALDENLNWKAHILHVANKISKSIGINLVLSLQIQIWS